MANPDKTLDYRPFGRFGCGRLCQIGRVRSCAICTTLFGSFLGAFSTRTVDRHGDRLVDAALFFWGTRQWNPTGYCSNTACRTGESHRYVVIATHRSRQDFFGGFCAGWRFFCRPGRPLGSSCRIDYACRSQVASRALRAQDLILAGGAAGVAAAFNTPLAGIVFAIEELERRLDTRTSGVLISTIILSGLVAIALLGNYNYFGHLKVDNLNRTIVVPIIVTGIICGLSGGLFSRLMLWPQEHKGFSLWRWRARHPVVFAGLCGMLVAVIGWVGGNLSYGSGYLITSQVVSGQIVMPWHAPLTRFLATLVSYYSGIPGGIFAPSLAVGAAIGSNVAQLLAVPAETIPIIALCMAGFLAAVTQAPITSAIIVMEMIDGHEMVISLMAVTLIAKAVSSRLSPALYQQLALGFLPTKEVPSSKEQ